MVTKKKKWSAKVHEESHALILPEGIFKRSAKEIARELKKAALESNVRKGTPYQSAMSMLNYYINRAGKNLASKDRERLEQAKVELRKIFGRK